MFSMNMALNLPEWYRLERETEKTIEKLTSLKELDYYLHNSDEYLRRLAIIRLSVLKPRECENILREMLEDHYESNENKELAAWVLKATASKWNMEIFINNRYLTRFTGNEKLSDINKITYDEQQPSIRFNFSSNQVCGQVPALEDILKYEGNAVLDTGFDYRQWISAFTGNIGNSLKTLLFDILKLIYKILRGAFNITFVKLPISIINSIRKIYKNRSKTLPKTRKSHIDEKSNYCSRLSSRAYNNPDLMPLVMKSREPYSYRPSVFSSIASVIKKVVFNMLYLFFYPVRLFMKHKLAMVCILLGVYVFLNFTSQGSILFKEYTGKDFLQFQMKTINTVKQFSISAWDVFKDFTKLDAVLGKKQGEIIGNNDPGFSNTPHYSVTAAKGLNIRKDPGSASEKVTGGSLAFGSIVTFLHKAETDSSGLTWYYIKAEDGRSGWVAAKYLIIKKEG